MSTYSKGTTFTATRYSGGSTTNGTLLYTVPALKWAEVFVFYNGGAGHLAFYANATTHQIADVGVYGPAIKDYAAIDVGYGRYPGAVVLPPAGTIYVITTGTSGYDFFVLEHSTS